MKLLLIEDNNDVINLVTEVAKKFNLKLEVGSNTSDYLDLTKRFRFKFIFCDINLDYKKEGFDILKIHRKRKLKSKIIAFSSSYTPKELKSNSSFDFILEKKAEKLIDFVKSLS